MIAEAQFSQKIIEKTLDNLVVMITSFGKSLIWALIIVIVGLKIASYVTKWTKQLIYRSRIEESVGTFLVSIVRIGLKVLVFIMAAIQLGVDNSSFVAVIGSAGVAIGLALQGSLSNMAGGCLILLLKPFQVGDYIKEDSHGNEGTVVGIDLFYTRIQTVDNKMIVVPNGVITSSSLTNVTRQEERLLDLRIGIGYEDDLLRAKEIIRNLAKQHSKTLDEEGIQVFVAELGDHCVILGLRVWVPTDEYNPIKWELLEKIKLEFDEQGINIPYQQMDVHIVK